MIWIILTSYYGLGLYLAFEVDSWSYGLQNPTEWIITISTAPILYPAIKLGLTISYYLTGGEEGF